FRKRFVLRSASLAAIAISIAGVAVPAADGVGKDAAGEQTALPIDAATGFVAKGDYMIVRAYCTACHSSKLVLQNRADRKGWERMIRWMQETQNLWDLGANEDKILDYLATYYGPLEQGRRAALEIEESDWYRIEQ
ncbi:MAG: hypothetical protein ACREIA_08915, partial [Opitutaceae bacterium]